MASTTLDADSMFCDINLMVLLRQEVLCRSQENRHPVKVGVGIRFLKRVKYLGAGQREQSYSQHSSLG